LPDLRTTKFTLNPCLALVRWQVGEYLGSYSGMLFEVAEVQKKVVVMVVCMCGMSAFVRVGFRGEGNSYVRAGRSDYGTVWCC
jgi:hypothetical protein